MPFNGPYLKLFCHLVWGTWDRHPLIPEECAARLHSMIRDKLREIDCVPIAVGGVEDHIHVLCQFPATLCVADLAKRIKGAISHFMNDEVTGREGFKWQGTYGAFTIGESAIPEVKAYVLNQRAHHAANDLHPDWERVWIPDLKPTERSGQYEESLNSPHA